MDKFQILKFLQKCLKGSISIYFSNFSKIKRLPKKGSLKFEKNHICDFNLDFTLSRDKI